MAKRSAPLVVELSTAQLEALLVKLAGALPAETYQLVETLLRTVPKTMVFYDFTGHKSRSLARPGRPNSVADLVRTSQPV